MVAKHLAGDEPEHAQDFNFTLKPVQASNPMPANAVDGVAEVSIHGAEVGAFGTITFEVPDTYKYIVRETAGNATGYAYDSAVFTVTYIVTAGEKEMNIESAITKTVDGVAAAADTVAFTNTFKHTPVQVSIPVAKTISGDTPSTAETFAFVLSAEGTADPLPANTRIEIKGAGTAEFGPITFDAPDTYKYNIEEVLGSADGYTYDNSVHEVVFVVEEVNGVLQATPSYVRDGQTVQGVTFNNIYTAPSAPVDVVLVKHLVDALIEPEEFGFALYDENNQQYGDIIYTTLGTHTNPEEDAYSSYVEIAFKDLVYYEPGIYNYTIRERMEGGTWVIEGDEWNQKGFEPGYYKGGVKYDDKQYPVVVTVFENDEGKLESIVDYPMAEGDMHELVNEYSKEYVEIDGNDSHPMNGRPADPEPEPSPTPEPTPTPKPQTPTKTPAKATTTPRTGSVHTADTNPVAPLTLVALVAAGTAGFAFTRRRKKE